MQNTKPKFSVMTYFTYEDLLKRGWSPYQIDIYFKPEKGKKVYNAQKVTTNEIYLIDVAKVKKEGKK